MKKFLVFLVILYSVYISFDSIKHPEHLICSDMEGYYTYLPSLFIYGRFDPAAIRDTGYIKLYPGTDKVFTKYTYGIALMELPFFLAGHGYAKITNGNTDGKNGIYGRALTMAGLFYFWLGIFIVYRLGRRYYPEWTVIASLSAIALGTNLFYYTFIQPAMSHVFSFFLFCCFLFLVDTMFIKDVLTLKKQYLYWVLLGLVSGMIVLIRPTNALILLLPLYILYRKKDFGLGFIKQYQVHNYIISCLYSNFCATIMVLETHHRRLGEMVIW